MVLNVVGLNVLMFRNVVLKLRLFLQIVNCKLTPHYGIVSSGDIDVEEQCPPTY